VTETRVAQHVLQVAGALADEPVLVEVGTQAILIDGSILSSDHELRSKVLGGVTGVGLGPSRDRPILRPQDGFEGERPRALHRSLPVCCARSRRAAATLARGCPGVSRSPREARSRACNGQGPTQVARNRVVFRCCNGRLCPGNVQGSWEAGDHDLSNVWQRSP